jgi:hypothetical protein
MAKSKVHTKEGMDKGSEEYVRGRRAGVEGTYGEKDDDVAEKTIVSAIGNGDGGGEDGLAATARSIYQKAVKNEGDDIGDRALIER